MAKRKHVNHAEIKNRTITQLERKVRDCKAEIKKEDLAHGTFFGLIPANTPKRHALEAQLDTYNKLLEQAYEVSLTLKQLEEFGL